MSEQPNPFVRPDLHLFGIVEAARILGTHKETVKAMVDARVLPCVRVGESGEPRFSLAMLEAWQVSVGSQSVSQSRGTQAPAAAPSRPQRTPTGVKG